jgi:hypothetical protein
VPTRSLTMMAGRADGMMPPISPLTGGRTQQGCMSAHAAHLIAVSAHLRYQQLARAHDHASNIAGCRTV